MATRRSAKARQGFPLIVGVIASPTDLRLATQMAQPPDLFELRLDHLFRGVDRLQSKLSILRAPLIVTARHPREGGANNLSLKQRRELLLRFLPRARYVDVELRSAKAFRALLDLAPLINLRRIISFHDFKSTPMSRNLRAKAYAAKSAGADIFKVATRTDTPSQLARLLEFVANNDADLAVSAMGIGKLGAVSRIALARGGSALNYVSLGPSRLEGQLRKGSRAPIISGLSIEQLRSALAR